MVVVIGLIVGGAAVMAGVAATIVAVLRDAPRPVRTRALYDTRNPDLSR